MLWMKIAQFLGKRMEMFLNISCLIIFKKFVNVITRMHTSKKILIL